MKVAGWRGASGGACLLDRSRRLLAAAEPEHWAAAANHPLHRLPVTLGVTQLHRGQVDGTETLPVVRLSSPGQRQKLPAGGPVTTGWRLVTMR